jgi:Mor family transcriptional regulator
MMIVIPQVPLRTKEGIQISQERNWRIYAGRCEGKTYERLSKEFCLAPVTIFEICKKKEKEWNGRQ